MSNFSRVAIKTAFIKLLDEHPLDSITVKDVVEECGVNRNTFYYHYRDLPALLDEIIKEEVDAVMEKYSSVNSIVDCLDALIEFASSHKRAVMHIYRSRNRDVFETSLMNLCRYIVQSYLDIALEHSALTKEDEKTIVNFYKCTFFGLIIDWLNNGMKEEYTHTVRKILSVKKNMAQEIAELMNNQI